MCMCVYVYINCIILRSQTPDFNESTLYYYAILAPTSETLYNSFTYAFCVYVCVNTEVFETPQVVTRNYSRDESSNIKNTDMCFDFQMHKLTKGQVKVINNHFIPCILW